MTYIKPQVIIHQEFAQSNDSEDSTLRAMIVGPNAVLHRYSDADEKEIIALGDYVPGSDTTYRFNDIGRTPGSVIDESSAKLYVDDALLSYFEDLTQTSLPNDATPKIYSDPTQTNVVIADEINFADNGQYTRNSGLDRDVQVGDYAWIRAYKGAGSASDPCNYYTHLSKIIGLSQEKAVRSNGGVGSVTVTGAATTSAADLDEDASNTLTMEASLKSDQTFDMYSAGTASPEFTITVTKVQTAVNCANKVTVKIESNFGYSVPELEVFENTAFDIGFNYEGTIASFTGIAVGQVYKFTQSFAYTRPTLTVAGTYKGDVNDTYIVEVTRGGVIGDTDTCPLITVRTALGLEYVPGVRVTSTSAQSIGGNGLTFALSGNVVVGQKFTFPVTAESYTKVNGLVLQNEIPAAMRTTDISSPVALDLRLLKKENVSTDSFTLNLTALEGPQFTVLGTITLDDVEFGTVTLFGGKAYMEYREWVSDAVGEIRYADNMTDITELISGQLDPANTLKYGVFKALSSSNGISVAYTAVKDPTDKDDWADALALVTGEEDIYTIVPLTQDISILKQAAAVIEAESGAEQCRWKAGAFSIPLETTKMIVGQSEYSLSKTSEDGNVVTATFTDPNLSDAVSEYTLVTIASGNAPLIEYGVAAGDEVRVVTGQGEVAYKIDTVTTDTTLRLVSGPSAAITDAVKIEIWRNLSKTAQAINFGERAASFGNRRIQVVAPDKVGENGVVLPSYFVAAEVAGLKSGVNANQGLTKTEITGFDDFSASKPYWTESQLNILASYGVCIIVEDANGTAYIRHALTTDMSSVFTQEEAITRDYDYICKRIHSLLQEYIGRSSVTDKVIDQIYSGVQTLLLSLVSSDYIRSYSDLTVQQHALLADRVEVNVTLAMPFPINNIEVFVTASKG